MIESKFSDFFRSPLGVLAVILLIIIGGTIVFLYVRSVFHRLINFTPAPI